MASIVLVILLFGGVYVFGKCTSPNVEVEQISDVTTPDSTSANLINLLNQKRNVYLIKVLIVSIILFMIVTNFLYTQDEAMTYLLSVIVAHVLIKEYEII